jgi:hypothetical protein
MTKVLIADDDMESHELIDDLIEINFRDVKIEHALNGESFWTKIAPVPCPFNLILFNVDLIKSGETDIVDRIRTERPELLGRMVFLVAKAGTLPVTVAGSVVIARPFSLDEFSDVVKKVCVD